MSEPRPTTGDIDEAITAEWARLARPGTWLDAAARIGVAEIARDRTTVDASDPVAHAASLVAHHPATATAEFVDGIEAAGIRREQYVEIVGVVSRLAAVDTFERGVGRCPRPLPEPLPGPPTRQTVPGARRGGGWVPTVGAISPPTALNAVPAEASAQMELHGALYLTIEEMADPRIQRELTRDQMELIAARVSWLNDCTY
jgi:alkylhydroperoxidase family enzyme